MEAYIKVEDVEKYYGSSGIITKAVERVSFEISKGEFIGIMGESGSGKTSLLNVLATIDTATAGHIYFEGKDITVMSDDEKAEFSEDYHDAVCPVFRSRICCAASGQTVLR